MKQGGKSSPPALGFLTVVEHAQQGLLGGYLVLNPSGRPLEFHCTAPVKPNRAQEILYGPTLQPYLYGELIAQTLITKAAVTPVAVVTDLKAVLSVRQHVSFPCVLLNETEPDEAASADVSAPGAMLRVDAPHSAASRLHTFRVGNTSVSVEPQSAADETQLRESLVAISSGDLDWSEPFERIRQAIEEAQRGSR